MKKILYLAAAFVAFGLAGLETAAQTPAGEFKAPVTAGVESSAADEKPVKEFSAKDDQSSSAAANSECRLCRWIDLQTATVSFRYRWVKSNQRISPAMNQVQPFLPAGEFVKIQQAQQQQVYEFDVKFDRAGRYKLHTRLSSGDWFTRSFAEVGWGEAFNGERGWKVLPRQFYFSAEPVKGLEIQYGGLGINRGENTEHTTYDNDGFITGQRVSLKRPDKIWFDELSATYAYIGDFYKPNFFERARRLGKSNYHQFLVAKKFGRRVAVSVDYSSHASISHLRQGVTVRTPEWKFVKNVKADFYQRLEDYRGVKKGWGYNFQAEMSFKDRLELTAGVAKTDYRYNVLTHEKYPARQALYAQPAGTLTADRMIRGLSPFASWKLKLNKYYGLFGFWTMDVNKPRPLPFVYNADHFSVGVQFDVRSMLKKTNIF